jgi:hypothetical protein
VLGTPEVRSNVRALWRGGLRNISPKTAPNTYEDSLCQETNYSYERTVRIFSAFQGLAPSTVGRVFSLAFHARCQPGVAAPNTY